MNPTAAETALVVIKCITALCSIPFILTAIMIPILLISLLKYTIKTDDFSFKEFLNLKRTKKKLKILLASIIAEIVIFILFGVLAILSYILLKASFSML